MSGSWLMLAFVPLLRTCEIGNQSNIASAVIWGKFAQGGAEGSRIGGIFRPWRGWFALGEPVTTPTPRL